jgi:hypothetical protein
MTAPRLNLLALDSFHATDTEVTLQTIDDSKISHSTRMAGFTVHHGAREGAPIVIVENDDHGPEALSAIWFDETQHTAHSSDVEHFRTTFAGAVARLIDKSQISHSIPMSGFTVHHGEHKSRPIVIVESGSSAPDAMSIFWFDNTL